MQHAYTNFMDFNNDDNSFDGSNSRRLDEIFNMITKKKSKMDSYITFNP